jgi:hypothetical protein
MYAADFPNVLIQVSVCRRCYRGRKYDLLACIDNKFIIYLRCHNKPDINIKFDTTNVKASCTQINRQNAAEGPYDNWLAILTNFYRLVKSLTGKQTNI